MIVHYFIDMITTHHPDVYLLPVTIIMLCNILFVVIHFLRYKCPLVTVGHAYLLHSIFSNHVYKLSTSLTVYVLTGNTGYSDI